MPAADVSCLPVELATRTGLGITLITVYQTLPRDHLNKGMVFMGVCPCVLQRASVRINLDGDVPSVPIPPHKRKPSLKQPMGGHRGSLAAPPDRSKTGFAAAFSGKRGPDSHTHAINASGASRDSSFGSNAGKAHTRATIAELLLGQKRGRSVKRAGVRCRDDDFCPPAKHACMHARQQAVCCPCA
jgi:hypothetical protein